MIRIELGTTPKEQEQSILVAIVCLTIGIFAADILLPLGFVIWILYLVPLLMSVWLPHRYAPFLMACVLSGALPLGGLITGSEQGRVSDLPYRAVFILMIAVISLLAWEIRSNYTSLKEEIAERRIAQENLEVLAGTLEKRVGMRTAELSDVNAELTRDITERLRIEEALATANQKLSLLAQITRHDISNRVFALLVNLDLAKDQSAAMNDAAMDANLRSMEKNIHGIQDQIAFAKDYQEIGAQTSGWYPVGEIIHASAVQLNLGNVQLDVSTGRLEIFADPLIGKVFYNLIDNAIRHGGDVSCITFSCRREGAVIIILCEDNGAGISERDKQHIFAKGFGKDSGLGLFLIREILGITGITIRETGEPGKGARFELTVPEGKFRDVP
ncbi:MAG: HAMP domain-containing histidine kinase [Methanoregula sp.]|jgi:signal transduction histidine kinase|nr:HAMP domain-containing histidine kinase [Methanoregula sp.]